MPKSVEELFDSSAFDATELAPTEQPAPEAQAAPETPAVAEQAETPAPEAQPAEAAAGQDKGAPPAPEEADGRDAAFGRYRKERNDYREQLNLEKVEKARIEERLTARDKEFSALQAQLEQLRQAQQAVPQHQQQHPSLPNPAEDPVGYAQSVLEMARATAAQAENRALFLSEAGARRIHGNDVVNAAKSWFDKEVSGKPQHAEVLAQPDPWDALVQRYQRAQAMAEIGDDPAAFKAKLIAEQRAQLEAEIRAQMAGEPAPEPNPTRQTANPNLPPSLGRVPNAGSRASGQYTGPAPIEALWG